MGVELYRRLACGSVLLQVGPVLWWLKWRNSILADSFVLIALPGLWTFLLGMATVVSYLWEKPRGIGAKVIVAGQIIGMAMQLVLSSLFLSGVLPTQLELSAIPMISGQIVVLIGLVLSHYRL